jgi:hypothetical protein
MLGRLTAVHVPQAVFAVGRSCLGTGIERTVGVHLNGAVSGATARVGAKAMVRSFLNGLAVTRLACV